MEERWNMSQRELDRYSVLQQVIGKKLTQKNAGILLGLKERQIRNLLRQIEERGPRGVISKHRDTKGNHRKSKEFKQRVLALLGEQYEGFGPTLASEKLKERQNLIVSAETLRLWMVECHLWVPRKQRHSLHPPRSRRACFGELVQGDGSPARWFGEEGPMVNLTVLIDDATGRLTGLHFSPTETAEAYFEVLRQHLQKHGRFRALYTDRSAIFQWKKPGCATQLHQALRALGIELILANSPQAKGRVERVHRTLQDRLAKELRLRGIKSIEEANAFAQEYMEKHNQIFSKKPMSDFDAHRPLEGYDLDRILSLHESRSLLSCGIFQFNWKFYQLQGVSNAEKLKGRQIEIRTTRQGMRVFLGKKELQARAMEEIEAPLVLSGKEVLHWKPREYKVSTAHPWKRGHQGLGIPLYQGTGVS